MPACRRRQQKDERKQRKTSNGSREMRARQIPEKPNQRKTGRAEFSGTRSGGRKDADRVPCDEEKNPSGATQRAGLVPQIHVDPGDQGEEPRHAHDHARRVITMSNPDH
ncbi:hypothetical protein ACFQ0O_30385 [Saccharopolyspora spinosporotrichia]